MAGQDQSGGGAGGGFQIGAGIDDGLGFALDRAIEAGIDLTPAMGDIAGHLQEAASLRFETGMSPIGLPWKKSQRAIDKDGKTLNDSGDLKGSMSLRYGKDFAEAGPDASGGAKRYARIHQLGGTIRPVKAKALSFGGRFVSKVVIPARPYLGWNETSERYAIDTLIVHIAKAFGVAANGAPA